MAKEFTKKTKSFKDLPEKVEKADGSASCGALFKEDIPKKMVISQDVFMNMNKNPAPDRKGLEYGAAEDDTLMGRLAKRMSSRDYIDQQNLGTKAPQAPSAATADLGVPHKMLIEGPAKELKKGTEVEKEHTSDPALAQKIAIDHLKESPNYYKELEKMETKLEKEKSIGRHQQTSDLEPFNSSDPYKFDKVTPGNNMADQAKNAGNVYPK